MPWNKLIPHGQFDVRIFKTVRILHLVGSSRRVRTKPCDGNMSQAIPSWFLGRLSSSSRHVSASSTTALGLSSTARHLSSTNPSITSSRLLYTARSVSRASQTKWPGPNIPRANSSRSLSSTPLHAAVPARGNRQAESIARATHSPILWRRFHCRAYSAGPKDRGSRKEVEPRQQTKDAERGEELNKGSSSSKGDSGASGAQEGPAPDTESFTSSMSKYLPSMPHRPTKEELLAAATNFRQRFKVRFKWMSIRSMRPWNADEWGAFVSWFMLGHLVWILLGTTTFFSLVIFSINTVFAQGKIPGRLDSSMY